MPEPVAWDAANPDLALLRQVIFRRLREQPDWKHLDPDPQERYAAFLELKPPRQDDRRVLERAVLEVFWQLVTEGIIAPGITANQGGFPFFQVTQYGRLVLQQNEYVPHDRTGYMQLLGHRVPNADATVLAYLTESLDTFGRGNRIASTVMLGIAAERVFDLLCESLNQALASTKEKAKLAELQKRVSLKARVDWVHTKLRAIQDQRIGGFPENAALMVTAIYDMIRLQRNDLGHPRAIPPRLSQGDAHANLLVFPRYYETAEIVRAVLAKKKV